MPQKEELDGIYKTFEGASMDILGDHRYRVRFIVEERELQSWVQEDTWKKKAVMTEYVNVSFL